MPDWVQPKPNWVSGVGMLAFVVILYLMKAAIVRRHTCRSAAVWFTPVLILAVPVSWALNDDWNNIHVYPVMNWVGFPVSLLAVPTVSFAFDLASVKGNNLPRSAWWYLPEVVLAVPAWAVFWAFFSFYALGWGWI